MPMKILYISNDWSGVASGIVTEMRGLGHEVLYLENGDISRIDNLSSHQRIVNFLFRAFTNKSLKKRRQSLSISRFLDGFIVDRDFDITIMNTPDIYERSNLEKLKSISGSFVCHLWDSVQKMPENLKNIDLFDTVFSFDDKDVARYGFSPVTNYIDGALEILSPSREIEGDLFGVFSYDSRYKTLVKILDANPSLKCMFVVYIHHPRRRKKVKDPRIMVITSPLTGDELRAISSRYTAVLDLAHSVQRGLSFRFYESVGQGQKLVTTNGTVVDSVMFDPNNIFVLDESNMVIDDGFFSSPFVPITDEIAAPYRAKNWVLDILQRAT